MKSNRKRFTFIDFFSGIGGFRIAAERLGGICVGFSEIDKKAIEVYKANFDTSNEEELGDITKLVNIPNVDIVFGGVPCQSWSVAGTKRGFNDSRGQLWLDAIRLVETSKPKAFVFENVKGLRDPKHHGALEYIKDAFRASGYNVYDKLLNAFDFGLAQNRDRIFIVGIKADLIGLKPFYFPHPKECMHKLYQVLDGLEIGSSSLKKKKFIPRDLFGERIPVSRNRFQKKDEMNDFFILCDTRNGHTTIHSWDIRRTSKKERQICLTILKNRRKSEYGPWDGNPLSFGSLKSLIPDLKKQELNKLIEKHILRQEEDGKYELVNTKNSAGINGVYRVFMPNSDVFSTLTATGTNDMVAIQTVLGRNPEEYKENFVKEILRKKKYRPITAREAARLQGFPDSLKLPDNERHAKRLFGNAVPVNVVEALVKSIADTGVFDVEEREEGLHELVSSNQKTD